MKPVLRLSLEVLRLLQAKQTFPGLALMEGVGVLWRREVREILNLLEEGRVCDAAVLSVMMARSEWFHKDFREKPPSGWRELDPILAEAVRRQDHLLAEEAARLKREATWPEARWLELLYRAYGGGKVGWEDLVFAVRFLANRRIVVERLGIGQGGRDEGYPHAKPGGDGQADSRGFGGEPLSGEGLGPGV